MATIKGLTLEIGGDTTSLTSALSGVNKTSRELQGELREIDRLLKVDPTNTELVAQKQKVLAESIAETNKKLEVLREAARQAQDQLERGEISEEQFRALQREVTKTEQNLDKLEKQAGDTGDDLGAAGKAAEQAGKAAKDSSTGWDKLGGGLKSAGELAAKVVVGLGTAAVGAAGAIGGMTLKAAQSADDINTLAKQTGLSVEQIQKFQFATEQIDVPLETLTGSMAKLTKNMNTAKKGTGDAYNAFQALGVAIKDDVTGELRNNQEVFDDAIAALAAMENETQRDAYAMSIFGKSAQDLNPLILGGVDALKELGDQAEAAGLILGQDALDNLNLVTDAMDTFKATVGGSGSLFATAFAGPIAEGINQVTGYAQQLTSAFSEGGFSALAETVASVLLDMVRQMKEILPDIIAFGIDLVLNFITGLLEMLPTIIETGIQMIAALVQSLADSLPELIPVAINAVLEIVSGLLDNMGPLLDAAFSLIQGLAQGLINSLPELAARIPEIIIKIVNVLTENLPKVLEMAATIIISLATGLIQALPQLVASLPQIIMAIVSGLAGGIPQILDVGKNIVRGLWDGILSMGAWIKDKVTGFFGGIVDGVKGVLGIHSPSKVFAGIGGNMAAGLGQGFSATMGQVTRDIQNAIPTDLESAIGYSVSRQPTGPPSPGSGGVDTAAVINALGTMLTGMGGGGGDLTVPVIINGVEFYRATIKDFRAVTAQSPEVTGDF